MAEARETRLELERVLERLDEVDEKIELLQLDKTQLRERIAELMGMLGRDRIKVDGGDHTTSLRLTRRTHITYDEGVLRERLGDRYRSILEPEMKRIRKHLPEIGHLLEPALDLVGAPTRERVEQQILEGSLSASDFAGAFDKNTTDVLYVRRSVSQPSSDLAADDDQDSPY